MLNYKNINNISGWLVFIISLVVYILTIEPTASFWDCGEFIACAYKLQVPHPPGSPLFMLLGRLFTMHIPIDGTPEQLAQVAFWINMVSAVSSAATILFLYWSITLIGRKMMKLAKNEEPDFGMTIGLVVSGLIGSLAYAFTDSFWFSAVEAEVYALSSFFTAFVFWAMLKWEVVSEEEGSDRWLLLIAFMVGLSTGVHLLNLVAIPALGFIYYFKKYKPTLTGMVVAFIASFVVLFLVLIIVIQKIPDWAGSTEIFFVNSLGLPFNSGIIFFFIILLGGLIFGVYYSEKIKNSILNTSLIAVVFILLGYSTYAIIMIRSNFDPPIDENNPENFISMLSYLKREQYGDRPLARGPQFTAMAPMQYEDGEPRYMRSGDEYVIYKHKTEAIYNEDHMVSFPRMHSTRGDHVNSYVAWMNANYPGYLKKDRRGMYERPPTGWQNLMYFFDRQIGHMYNRYFKWNFVGRDGHVQDSGSILFEGGNADQPELLRSGARNQYFALPLILGLIGILFMALKARKDLFVVALLFFFTGIAIVIYLNNPAFEPRERDYTYVGSFYAFAIWIGLGALGIFNGFRSGVLFEKGALFSKEIKMPVKTSTMTAAIISLGMTIAVPGVLAVENWDDHDRAERYFSIDQAKNLLESCAPNAILFTGGDNDTFPLWYVQEVEGFRRDVRVCNLSLLNTDWYIDQMRRKAYISEPLPITMEPDDYRDGTNDYAVIKKNGAGEPITSGVMDVAKYIKAVRANNSQTYIYDSRSNENRRIFLTRTMSVPVNGINVMDVERRKESDANDQGMLPAEIEPRLKNGKLVWDIQSNTIQKKHFIMLDMISQIAKSGWDRPIYFSAGISRADYLNLDDYMILEGMAYRLVPVKVKNSANNEEYVNTEVMYNNLINKYHFRNLDREDIYYSEDYNRMVRSHRLYYYLLSDFMMKKDKEKAKEVLQFSLDKMPDKCFPMEAGYVTVRTLDMLRKLGMDEEASELSDEIVSRSFELIDHYEDEEDAIRMNAEKKAVFKKSMQELLGVNGILASFAESTSDLNEEQAQMINKVIRKNKEYMDRIDAMNWMESMRNEYSRSIYITFDFIDKLKASKHKDLVKDLDEWATAKGKLIGRP